MLPNSLPLSKIQINMYFVVCVHPRKLWSLTKDILNREKFVYLGTRYNGYMALEIINTIPL